MDEKPAESGMAGLFWVADANNEAASIALAVPLTDRRLRRHADRGNGAISIIGHDWLTAARVASWTGTL
jgi:hypothetical protein